MVKDLHVKYPNAAIKGHYQMKSGKAQRKTCPDFPVPEWVANGMQPISEHTA
jgi:hypothetical protein